jgi:hypothetical protein
LEYLGVEGRIILKWREDERAWTELSHERDIVLGSFEHGVVRSNTRNF